MVGSLDDVKMKMGGVANQPRSSRFGGTLFRFGGFVAIHLTKMTIDNFRLVS